MDSMVNRYTSDRRVRSDDAYTPGGVGGKRPDRCVIVYSQRVREAYKDVPIVIGGIEASLRRIAHFDYWSEQVRRSVLVDAKADLLVYGNAERQIVEIARRLDAGRGDREHHGFARHRIRAPRRTATIGSRSIRASSTLPGRSHRRRIRMPARTTRRAARRSASPRRERRRTRHRVVQVFPPGAERRSASAASSVCLPSSR